MKLTTSVILAIIVASSGAAFGADAGARYGLKTAPRATTKTAAAIPRWEKSSVWKITPRARASVTPRGECH